MSTSATRRSVSSSTRRVKCSRTCRVTCRTEFGHATAISTRTVTSPPSTVASTRAALFRRRPETDAEQVTCRSGGALHLGDRSGRDLFTTLSATLVRLRSAAVARVGESVAAGSGWVRAGVFTAAAAAAAPVGRQIQPPSTTRPATNPAAPRTATRTKALNPAECLRLSVKPVVANDAGAHPDLLAVCGIDGLQLVDSSMPPPGPPPAQ